MRNELVCSMPVPQDQSSFASSRRDGPARLYTLPFSSRATALWQSRATEGSEERGVPTTWAALLQNLRCGDRLSAASQLLAGPPEMLIPKLENSGSYSTRVSRFAQWSIWSYIGYKAEVYRTQPQVRAMEPNHSKRRPPQVSRHG